MSKNMPNPFKKVQTDDLDKEQAKMLKDMLTKEILKKIERRIESEDENIMKALKGMIEDEKKK